MNKALEVERDFLKEDCYFRDCEKCLLRSLRMSKELLRIASDKLVIRGLWLITVDKFEKFVGLLFVG